MTDDSIHVVFLVTIESEEIQMQFNRLLFTFSHKTNLIMIWLGFPGYIQSRDSTTVQKKVVMPLKLFGNCQKCQKKSKQFSSKNYALAVTTG